MEGIKSNVKIADDVVAVISAIAGTSVEGVVTIGDNITEKTAKTASSNLLKNGIEIIKDADNKNVVVKINVVLKQGDDLTKICFKVQEKVKESIESMLDINVSEVSVRIVKVVEG